MGAIRVVDLNTKSVLATPFLTIGDTDAANEGGFLGLAFHPNYANPGKTGYGQFYVYVTVDGALPVHRRHSSHSNVVIFDAYSPLQCFVESVGC